MKGVMFWTQLRDITMPDVIHMDGVPVPDDQLDRRSQIVEHISAVAQTRRREASSTGGFTAWGAKTTVAEIPARVPEDPEFYPSILVCAKNDVLHSAPLDELQDATRRFAAASGLTVDSDVMASTFQMMKRGYRRGCLPKLGAR